jgi:hypothetical protein
MQIKAKISLFFLLILLFGCKKNADEIFPQITFLSPFEGHVFDGDSIRFSVHVTDNSNLASIRLGLLNENKISVVTPLYIVPHKNDTIIEVTFFKDATLKEGSYFLHVQASDGVNVKNQYREVKLLRNDIVNIFALLAQRNSGQSKIWKMNSVSGAVSLLMQRDYEIEALLSVAETQKLYLMTKFPSELQAWNLAGNQHFWTVSSVFPHKSFTALSSKNSHLCVAEKAGLIKKIHGNTGQIMLTTLTQVDTSAYCLLETDDFIIAAQKTTGNRHILCAFNSATGTLLRKELLEAELTGMFEMADKRILLVVKHSTGFAIDVYDIQNQHFNRVFSSNQFQAVFSSITKSGQLLLATNYKIFNCDFMNNELVEIFDSPVAMVVNFEPQQQLLYVVQGLFMKIIKPDGTITNQYNLPETIDMIEFSYASK